jgi:two-component system, NtrC family, response regulator HydG
MASTQPTCEELIQRIEKLEMQCNRANLDLQRTKTALEDSEVRYLSLLGEIEDGYLEADPKLNIYLVNSSLCKIFGVSKEEFLGSYANMSFVEKKSRRAIQNGYKTVYSSGKPNRGIIHTITRKNGEKRILENSISLKRNAKGEPVGFRSIVRDITERKRAEEELAKHRSRLNAIFESVKDAIFSVDKNMTITEANEATEKICGVPREEMIGKKFFDLHQHCAGACSHIVTKSLEQGTPSGECRLECRHKNNPQQIVVLTSFPLVGQDGNPQGAVLVAKDITRISNLERQLNERNRFQNIIGKSRKMQETYSLLEDLSDIETTVLITGESGTGKEVVANALHYSGTRTDKPLIKVNCSALAENLLESELFGHVKGAFTGAVRDKQGRFQAAHGGTILLDEIGDISPRIQLKLLRVLQEKEFERVGESATLKVDVRVIACTNQNLKQKVREGDFREDLYYRLKVVEIEIPPLRERSEDIPLLIEHFCNHFNKQFKKQIEGVSDEVLMIFMNYPWPGNVRELEHVIERAFVLCRDRIIRIEHISSEIRDHVGRQPIDVEGPVIRERSNLDRQVLLNTLKKTGWNKARTARLLGVGRQTLYRKLYQYNLLEPEPDA